MRKLTKTLGMIVLALTLTLTGCGDTTPKHQAEVTGQEFATIHDDYNVVCVYTDYTNNSGESAIPADWIDIKAYQNGVALSPIVFTGEEYNGYMPCDTSIQDGTSAKIVWIFQTDDTETEVEVKVSDL